MQRDAIECALMQQGRARILIYVCTWIVTLRPPHSVISSMSHISIFQPEDTTSSEPIVLPHSFLALKEANALEDTDTSSGLILADLKRFLEDERRRVLGQLRGSAAAEVADFLDTVCKSDLTATYLELRPTNYLVVDK